MPNLSYSEMYKWTDKEGTVNFTDDLSKVPDEHRQKQILPENNNNSDGQDRKAIQPSASARTVEKTAFTIREIPTNDSIRYELLASARSLASGGKADYQAWLRMEQQLNKLMAAANYDRKNILREFLSYCSYDMKGGQANELIEYYGFWAIQAYFNFTEEEVTAVTKPYVNSNDQKVKDNIKNLLLMANRKYWQKQHDELMAQIEKIKANK